MYKKLEDIIFLYLDWIERRYGVGDSGRGSEGEESRDGRAAR